MSYKDVYYRQKTLNMEWKSMFGNTPYGHFLSDKAKKAWEQHVTQLDQTAKGPGLLESAVGYGITRAAGTAIAAPVKMAVDLGEYAAKKNYARGFMEYRAKPYYVNYHIKPIWIRRRRTRAYRPNLKAYSLPFYYSRAGPAYQHNRRTRNFWYWRR